MELISNVPIFYEVPLKLYCEDIKNSPLIYRNHDVKYF